MNRVAAAAVTGALVSGAAMYAVGARTQVSAFTPPPAGQVQDVRQTAIEPIALRPADAVQGAVPPAFVGTGVGTGTTQRVATTSSPRRTSRPAAVQERTVAREAPERRDRTWAKTAMIIGGSAASGAAVGGIVDGKKGALIGAAIGGGAASIYEATRRR
jgi:hypothetical protein